LPLIVLAVAGSVAVGGACFLGGYTVGYMQHKPVVVVTTAAPTTTPSPTESATPTPTATPKPTLTPIPTPSPTPSPLATPVDCYQFGDFPYYPGSLQVNASTQDARAWHVNAIASKVATYFANGANQVAWQFRLTSATGSAWVFRFTRAPSCRGSLTVRSDSGGGTFYQATPDSQ
jgi:hypothetical protein